jgi:hypothetical protein
MVDALDLFQCTRCGSFFVPPKYAPGEDYCSECLTAKLLTPELPRGSTIDMEV